MRRRSLLRRVSALATVVLAGCAGDGGDAPTNSPDPEDTPAETATATATPPSTATTAADAETDTRSETDEPSGERTSSPTETGGETATSSATDAETATPSATDTERATATPTATATDTETATATATESVDVAQVVEVAPDGSLSFSPEEFAVETGDTVRWTWDGSGHNVRPSATPEGSSWSGTAGGDSETYDEGHTYEHEFTAAGDYEYYCSPHRSLGMTGSFTVE